jgi:hypothetical protein
MEQSAPAGALRISAETYRQVRGRGSTSPSSRSFRSWVSKPRSRTVPGFHGRESGDGSTPAWHRGMVVPPLEVRGAIGARTRLACAFGICGRLRRWQSLTLVGDAGLRAQSHGFIAPRVQAIGRATRQKPQQRSGENRYEDSRLARTRRDRPSLTVCWATCLQIQVSDRWESDDEPAWFHRTNGSATNTVARPLGSLGRTQSQSLGQPGWDFGL